jgi:sigma-B regulation protein RsbU (phosphoserine phosphatase)
MPAMSADRGVTVQMPLFGEAEPRAAVLHDVHAISIPARAFTGDFYFLHRDANRLWFALGDVAGKGINAAVVMAMIQEELEHRIVSCARTGCDPSVTMTRLHAFLKPLVPLNKFATVVIGNLHDDGTLMLTNAGHCSPMIVRANGAIESIASTGPVVGILPSSEWSTFETTLAKGEALVIYSDGVLEAQSSSGEEFGCGRIEDGLKPVPHSASEIAEKLARAVEQHTGGVQTDDLTIVVVRR